MTDLETSAAVANKIARMAARAFAEHVLVCKNRDERFSWWLLSKPGTNVYASRLFFAPGVICVYGDVGETILRVSEREPIGWLLGPTPNEYLLAKVKAASGEKERFYPGDARQWCEEMRRDSVDDDRYGRLIHEIDAHDWSEEHDPAYRWLGLCSDQQPSIDDPPRCQGPTEQMLWLFESLRCFVRLFRASGFVR